ncbi:MAG: hypothetical protein QXZ09_09885, partial [Candidatus Methanomethylicaceae archaeon]
PGDWSSFLKAEQLFYEVYGKKIEAAKTPEAKAALAKELLELAKKETDQLAKRVELEQAKRLAVEGRNISLAVDAVRELAVLTSDDLPSDLLSEAEAMWIESRTDEERLNALELYYRAKNVSPLIEQKWRGRIEQLLDSGTTVFLAESAKLVGTKLYYQRDLGAIDGWVSPADYMEWVATLEPGTYNVIVTYAADPPMASESLFAFGLFQNEKAKKPIVYVTSTLGPTGPWATFVEHRFGIIRVPKSGQYVLRLYVVRKQPDKLDRGIIALKRITLSRQ